MAIYYNPTLNAFWDDALGEPPSGYTASVTPVQYLNAMNQQTMGNHKIIPSGDTFSTASRSNADASEIRSQMDHRMRGDVIMDANDAALFATAQGAYGLANSTGTQGVTFDTTSATLQSAEEGPAIVLTHTTASNGQAELRNAATIDVAAATVAMGGAIKLRIDSSDQVYGQLNAVVDNNVNFVTLSNEGSSGGVPKIELSASSSTSLIELISGGNGSLWIWGTEVEFDGFDDVYFNGGDVSGINDLSVNGAASVTGNVTGSGRVQDSSGNSVGDMVKSLSLGANNENIVATNGFGATAGLAIDALIGSILAGIGATAQTSGGQAVGFTGTGAVSLFTFTTATPKSAGEIVDGSALAFAAMYVDGNGDFKVSAPGSVAPTGKWRLLSAAIAAGAPNVVLAVRQPDPTVVTFYFAANQTSGKTIYNTAAKLYDGNGQLVPYSNRYTVSAITAADGTTSANQTLMWHITNNPQNASFSNLDGDLAFKLTGYYGTAYSLTLTLS